MLQQTRVETVIPYFQRFMERFPTVERLAQAELEEVLKLWEGLGYYSRARNLHRAAGIICEQYGGKLPKSKEDIIKLPGIGAYIAAAVTSIAFQAPAAVVDGNVKRVLARLYAEPSPANDPRSKKSYEHLAQTLLDCSDPGQFNQAVMELGQRICTPKKPLCPQCPLGAYCKAYEKRSVDNYPKRIASRKTPLRKMVFALISQKGKWLIVRRPPEGLLGGLWEFPGGEVPAKTDPQEWLAAAVYQQTAIRIGDIRHLGNTRHAYTHFRVSAEVYTCRHRSGSVRLEGPDDHRWVEPERVKQFPLHKLVHKMLWLTH